MKKSEKTRADLLRVAKALFRKKGFDGTSMQDIARQAKMAVGAAYYYFPSKDAFALAYYEELRREQLETTRKRLEGVTGLGERVKVVFTVQLEIARRERKLISALTRVLADPGHPFSVLSPKTAHLRAKGTGLFAEAIAGCGLSAEVQAVLPRTLWVLQMALLFYFVHDRSPKQRNTDRLHEQFFAALPQLVALADLPFVQPWMGELHGVFDLLAI